MPSSSNIFSCRPLTKVFVQSTKRYCSLWKRSDHKDRIFFLSRCLKRNRFFFPITGLILLRPPFIRKVFLNSEFVEKSNYLRYAWSAFVKMNRMCFFYISTFFSDILKPRIMYVGRNVASGCCSVVGQIVFCYYGIFSGSIHANTQKVTLCFLLKIKSAIFLLENFFLFVLFRNIKCYIAYDL